MLKEHMLAARAESFRKKDSYNLVCVFGQFEKGKKPEDFSK